MSDIANLWDERRLRLSAAVKKAVLELLKHTESDCALMVDVDPNDPNCIVLMGNKESLRHLIDPVKELSGSQESC